MLYSALKIQINLASAPPRGKAAPKGGQKSKELPILVGITTVLVAGLML
jgi:hypothetical protein